MAASDPIVFDDPRAVLRHVLSSAPRRAVVWPSERYYYYRFTDGLRQVSGNLRFVDAEAGILHIGYFNAHDPSDQRAASFSASDGVSVRWDASTKTARVECEGIARDFRLDAFADSTPVFPLLFGERLVSRVIDESGFWFVLLFHEPTAQFYFVLEPCQPLPESLSRAGSTLPIEVGQESRYVFLLDEATGRRVLCGVHASNIRQNNYFDGPFDQVPPRLPLREMLERAYPYVRYRGGIDEHGNFVRLEGQRVAISPYQAYESLGALTNWLGHVDASECPLPWLPAVFETKSLFHLELEAMESARRETVEHVVDISRAWPANHWGDSSLLWPTTHDSRASLAWPPNHQRGQSHREQGQ